MVVIIGDHVGMWNNGAYQRRAPQYFGWSKYEFWRFVFVQQVIGKDILKNETPSRSISGFCVHVLFGMPASARTGIAVSSGG